VRVSSMATMPTASKVRWTKRWKMGKSHKWRYASTSRRDGYHGRLKKELASFLLIPITIDSGTASDRSLRGAKRCVSNAG
jgi:hypothetical protein